MKLTALLTAVAAASVGLLSSCSNSIGGGTSMAAYNAYDRPASLPSNPANVRVKVSLSKQIAYVMEGDKPLLVMPVSVGAKGSTTPVGSYTIFNKEHLHRANTHGYATNGKQYVKTMLSAKPSGWSFKGTPMPYWCEFKPNYGFHTGWLKPYPCTHGCIRMHHNIAPKFFRIVGTGTQVSIAQSQPEDETLGKNFKFSPDAGPLPDFPESFYYGEGYFTHHHTPSYN